MSTPCAACVPLLAKGREQVLFTVGESEDWESCFFLFQIVVKYT